MYFLVGIIILFVLHLPAAGQLTSDNCSKRFDYRNKNMVDPEPIQTSSVEGLVNDSTKTVPGMCVALFSKDGKTRIALTKTDDDGKFRFRNVPDGEYRLVARIDYDFLCPANAIVTVKKQAEKVGLKINMLPSGIDECSDVEAEEVAKKSPKRPSTRSSLYLS